MMPHDDLLLKSHDHVPDEFNPYPPMNLGFEQSPQFENNFTRKSQDGRQTRLKIMHNSVLTNMQFLILPLNYKNKHFFY